MKKVKLGLIMTVLVSSSLMAQQSVSQEEKKFEMKTLVSENSQLGKNTTEKTANQASAIFEIKMYPNPASDIVTLQGVNVDDVIVITDNKGKNRIQIKAKAEVEIIPIHFLESGVYLVSVNGEKKRLLVE